MLLVAASLCLACAGTARAHTTYLPLVAKPTTPTPGACAPIPGARYAGLTIVGAPSPLAGADHPDMNPARRGYTAAEGQYVGLVGNCGATPDDMGAPQLRGLFDDHRRPTFVGVFWVYQWDWDRDRPSSEVEDRWGPSFVQVATAPGELLSVPPAGRLIDEGQQLQVLVLYASEDWITLKYTREDDVRIGYTLHLQGVCVDPPLLALYNALEAAGRERLPALRAGQAFARARGTALGLSIRDCGDWMDPRLCADWWRQ